MDINLFKNKIEIKKLSGYYYKNFIAIKIYINLTLYRYYGILGSTKQILSILEDSSYSYSHNFNLCESSLNQLFKNENWKGKYFNNMKILYNMIYSYFIYNKYYTLCNYDKYYITFINNIYDYKIFNCRDFYKLYSFI